MMGKDNRNEDCVPGSYEPPCGFSLGAMRRTQTILLSVVKFVKALLFVRID